MNGSRLKEFSAGALALASLVTLGQLEANPSNSPASSPPDPDTRGKELRALSESVRERNVADKQRIEKFIRDTGIPQRQILPGGRVLELQRFSPAGRPIFYLTYNVDAADTVSTDELWPGGRTGLNLTGDGMFTAIWDGGAVDPTHVDFDVRLNQVDLPGKVSGHATHVAGTLVGSGVGYPFTQGGNFLAQGMAFEADLDAYDWELDTAEMADAALAGLLVSNHSYGIAAGWVNTLGAMPDDVNLEGNPDVSIYDWWWVGGPGLEDPNFGYYDNQSQEWDDVAFNAPDYLIVKAAGNDRQDLGPTDGEPYLVIGDYNELTNTYAWSESTLSRPFDCAPFGYDCLPTNSVAKNILTVGAVDDLPGGYLPLAGPGQVTTTAFTAWGPTDDGRIKPDLVGNGVFLFSTYAPNTYALASGTSMSAPNITGSLLLLQQHFQNRNSGASMSAATLKALAIHTADEAGEFDGPDYIFGWGLFNAEKAANLITSAAQGSGDHHIIEGTLANGAVDSHVIPITATDARVTVTLVWTDPPATPVEPQVLDAPNLMLVNDLDLRVSVGSEIYFPWVLDPANPSNAATRGDNFRDNVEQVVITGGAPGTYTITVRSHESSVIQNGPQAYSLLVSQKPEPPTTSEFIIDEDFSGGLPAGWSVGGAGVPWAVYDPIPGDSRYDNFTLGSGRYAMVDVNYSEYTNSWLELPELDLSAAPSVIVRFQSFYHYDEWERLYFELSTDGGANFSTIWQAQGFAPYPTSHVLDVPEAVGEPSAIFRFRFDSFSDAAGNLWQIDAVQVEAVGTAPDPDPEPEPSPPPAASDPTPAHGAVEQPLNVPLGWTAEVGTELNVYLGTSELLDASDWHGSPSGNSIDSGPLAYGQTYYWRVDVTNAGGTTTGTPWSFQTVPEPSVPPTVEALALADLTATQIPGNRGRWDAEVEALVQDNAGQPVDGVTITGDWSGDTRGTDSCFTGANGRCTLAKSNLKNNVVTVSFTVTNLEKAGFSYVPSDNLVPATVTLGGSTEPDPPPPTGDGSLTLNAYKVKGIQHVDLDWNGIAGTTVDIFRDGVEISDETTSNNVTYTDNIGVKGGGRYEYAVCEVGTSTCVTGVAVF